VEDLLHPVMPESEELSDSELGELLRETFRSEVGTALDGVRISCRSGIVLLTGVAASDQLVQVARQIVEDEVGLEVIDRVAVSPFAAESRRTERRIRLPLDVGHDYDTGMGIYYYAGDGFDDGYSPPDRPVAETE
jgi:hypothetical protein